MKKTTDKIVRVLSETEGSLRDVIVQAAQAADYQGVDVARAAAQEVHNLRVRVSGEVPPPERSTVDTKSHRAKSRCARRQPSRKRAAAGYPRFEVRNGTLVRTGWSKKQGQEYLHKAPKPVFDLTVKAMATLSQERSGPITAEQVIDQVNLSDSQTTPNYQIYVVVGFLRAQGCIEQVGREGYRIPTDLCLEAAALWQAATE